MLSLQELQKLALCRLTTVLRRSCGIIWLLVCRGTWRDAEFKAYNFNALGQPTNGGHLHPLLKVSLRTMFTIAAHS